VLSALGRGSPASAKMHKSRFLVVSSFLTIIFSKIIDVDGYFREATPLAVYMSLIENGDIDVIWASLNYVKYFIFSAKPTCRTSTEITGFYCH
jgi:hypothetical protein